MKGRRRRLQAAITENAFGRGFDAAAVALEVPGYTPAIQLWEHGGYLQNSGGIYRISRGSCAAIAAGGAAACGWFG